MGLTLRQQAVVDIDGHGECIALPGSGKSHTVVHCVKKRIQENSSNYIVAISFTRKAAQELRERLLKEIGSQKLEMHVRVTTFDALFIAQLKQAMGTSKFNIMSNAERYNLTQRSLGALGLKMKLDEAMAVIDKFGGFTEVPESLAAAQPDHFELFQKYNELRVAKRQWDFPSIARTVVVAQEEGRIPLVPLTHLIVDEFQDTSDIQFRWIAAYADRSKIDANVLVVGDDDQAIYAFRHSRGYQNFVNFKKVFEPTTHVLDTCFRCKPNILNCAKVLIEHNNDRVPKSMSSFHDEGGKIQVWRTEEADEEVEIILERLSSCLLPGDPDFDIDAPKHWAVLSRTNRQLWQLAAMLEVAGINYRTKPSESILCSPNADMVNKLLNMVVRETKHNAADILSWLGATEDEIVRSRQSGGLSRRYSVLNYRLPEGKSVPTNPDEWLFFTVQQLICQQSNLSSGVDAIKELMDARFDIKRVPAKSRENQRRSFEALLQIFTTAGNEFSFRDSAMTFNKMVLKANQPPNKTTEEFTEGVDLLTLHSSKGLQWDAVWLMGLTQNELPEEAAPLAEMEEERRLVYVGMTRAMTELQMSYIGEPSRFIDEMRGYLDSLEDQGTEVWAS